MDDGVEVSPDSLDRRLVSPGSAALRKRVSSSHRGILPDVFEKGSGRHLRPNAAPRASPPEQAWARTLDGQGQVAALGRGSETGKAVWPREKFLDVRAEHLGAHRTTTLHIS